MKTKANLMDTKRICNVEPCPSYSSSSSTEYSIAVVIDFTQLDWWWYSKLFSLKKTSRSIVSNWWTSEWGKCDEKCEKSRTVKCRSHLGIGCPVDKKPLSRRKCCTIKYVFNWSNVSSISVIKLTRLVQEKKKKIKKLFLISVVHKSNWKILLKNNFINLFTPKLPQPMHLSRSLKHSLSYLF